MAFTYVTLTHQFRIADESNAAGTIEFTPVVPMHNGGTVISSKVTATLVAGALSQKLAANTDPATTPPGTTYKVVERITGQPANTYFIQVPHDDGSPIDLGVLSGWVGGGPEAVVETVNGVAPDVNGNVLVDTTSIGAQPADSDLTTFAGLTPSNDDVVQRKSGAWTNRTPAQLKTDLAVGAADLTATGTRNNTTYLRGDNTWQTVSGGGVTDHGALTGLSDDDHSIYHTDARGDARYYTQSQVTTFLAGKAATTHNHAATDINSGTLGNSYLPKVLSPTRTATPSGGTISVDADVAGNYLNSTLTGDATLNVPTNGAAEQVLQGAAFASGAQRVLTFHASYGRLSGIGSTLTIPSGKVGRYTLRRTDITGSAKWLVEAAAVEQ